MNVTWKNNLMNQGLYTNFSFNSNQVVTGKDAKMTLAGTTIDMYEPSSTSDLLDYSTDDYNNVLDDIRGRDRGTSAKIPGASQISGSVSKVMPSKTSVGAPFFNNQTTGNDNLRINKPFSYVIINAELQLESRQSGKLCIYNLSGNELANSPIIANTNFKKLLEKGIYILSFITDKGNNFSEKIIIR